MTGPEECTLGNVEFEWDPNSPILGVLDGHGVEVEGQAGGDCGMIDRPTSTIIDRSGGMHIHKNDRIRHSKDICLEGRERAAS